MTGAATLNAKRHPTALVVVVLMHGAAIGALALAKMDVIGPTRAPPTIVDFIKDPPPPEPPKPVDKAVQPKQDTVITRPPPLLRLPQPGPVVDYKPTPIPTFVIPDPGPTIIVPPSPPPPPPPPPPAARKVEPARAKANLGSYVSDADYPPAAVRNEEQGTTRFRLAVTPDGRVAECTVTGSSGSSSLDAATCRLMKQRARFSPARDSEGKPTGDTVSSSIRWHLPDE